MARGNYIPSAPVSSYNHVKYSMYLETAKPIIR